jgi:hypothetical protein
MSAHEVNSTNWVRYLDDKLKKYDIEPEKIEKDLETLICTDVAECYDLNGKNKLVFENSQSVEHFYNIVTEKRLRENNLSENIRSDDENLTRIFKSFNNFSTGNKFSVGDSVSLLELRAEKCTTGNIFLNGFISNKKITAIESNLHVVYFDDGSRYPEITTTLKQTRMWVQTILFDNHSKAERCRVFMTLLVDKSFSDWSFHDNVKE